MGALPLIGTGLTSAGRFQNHVKPGFGVGLQRNPAWGWFWNSCLFCHPFEYPVSYAAGTDTWSQGDLSGHEIRLRVSLATPPSVVPTSYGWGAFCLPQAGEPTAFQSAVPQPSTWPAPLNQFTIAMIYQHTGDFSGQTHYFFNHSTTAEDSIALTLDSGGGNPTGRLGFGLGGNMFHWAADPVPLLKTQMCRLVAVYDGTNRTTYIEGESPGTNVLIGAGPFPVTGNTFIGCRNTKISDMGQTHIAFVSFHNQAWTPAQMRAWTNDPYGMLWPSNVLVEVPQDPGFILDGFLRTGPQFLRGAALTNESFTGRSKSVESLAGLANFVTSTQFEKMAVSQALQGQLVVKRRREKS